MGRKIPLLSLEATSTCPKAGGFITPIFFFLLAYMTASVICSHKNFQPQYETQSALFVSVVFLRLQIPLLCNALDAAISFRSPPCAAL